jgi:hypothetical protein
VETVFDWITVAIFAGLIVLFMQRSTEEEPRDKLWQYLLPSTGCAVANYLGNEGLKDGNQAFVILGVLVIGGVLGYIYYVLKPFDDWLKPKS